MVYSKIAGLEHVMKRSPFNDVIFEP